MKPRVRVSLSDGVLEFEGSESFVTSQVEKFTKIIQTALAGERPIADDTASGDDGGTTAAGGNGAGSDTQTAASTPPAPAVDLKDIFEATDTGVQILRPIPGSSKAQKAVNGAKLYLYGLQALKQRVQTRKSAMPSPPRRILKLSPAQSRSMPNVTPRKPRSSCRSRTANSNTWKRSSLEATLRRFLFADAK